MAGGTLGPTHHPRCIQNSSIGWHLFLTPSIVTLGIVDLCFYFVYHTDMMSALDIIIVMIWIHYFFFLCHMIFKLRSEMSYRGKLQAMRLLQSRGHIVLPSIF